MKLLFCHLLNNYTGSPKVLSVLLKELAADNDFEISILTSKTDGVLNGIQNLKYYDNWYRWHENKILRIFRFTLSQLRNFFFVCFADFDILYMNTVVPFGATLAAKLRKKKIIYHVHEVYINPNFVKRLYLVIMRKCAAKIICVSKYVKENVNLENTIFIYNPIEYSCMPLDVDSYLKNKLERKIIFMPTSLKKYKGVFQFVELARLMPDFNFVLLCSVELIELQKFFSRTSLPENLSLVGKQNCLKEFYREAVITMNLSLYDKFTETFGLTVLESFDALVPAIAPSYGGPTEIIQNGKNGFLVDPYNLKEISGCIKKITNDFDTYKSFAVYAKQRAKDFNKQEFLREIKVVIIQVSQETVLNNSRWGGVRQVLFNSVPEYKRQCGQVVFNFLSLT